MSTSKALRCIQGQVCFVDVEGALSYLECDATVCPPFWRNRRRSWGFWKSASFIFFLGFFKNEGIFASCEKPTWEGKKGGKFVSDGHKFSCSTEERSSARAGGKGRDGD